MEEITTVRNDIRRGVIRLLQYPPAARLKRLEKEVAMYMHILKTVCVQELK